MLLLKKGDCMTNSLMKQRADAQFRMPVEDELAQAGYEAAADALAAKIARLKELRLARDAAEPAAPPKASRVKKPGKKAGTKKKQDKRPAESLLDWLKHRHANV
jgi:hypothetical protein